MKLEIKERGSSYVYDEYLYIMSKYDSLVKNPHMKVHRLSKDAIRLGTISLILFIVFLVLSILDSSYKLHTYLCIFSGFLVLLSLLYHFMIIKRIKAFMNVKGTITVTFDEDHIEYKTSEHTYKIKWKDVKYITINEYTVCFIPKDIKKILLAINIKYKKDILKYVKEIGKADLIIDNTKKK